MRQVEGSSANLVLIFPPRSSQFWATRPVYCEAGNVIASDRISSLWSGIQRRRGASTLRLCVIIPLAVQRG